ncbi:MAG TPA: branched-chain amino acid ABC transporter permease [Candidatus Baltobacteraceae bacterium]|nr:branched-chain amino acid ABC transporter permease [Candidatus Baltobacteraceae bacterium]
MIWFDQIVEGVLLGGYYALLACGLSFMFGVMRIINLAHGSLAVFSAFLVLTISTQWNLSPFVALLIVIPIMAIVGWLLQRGIIDRSLRYGELVPLLSTFGLAIVIDNVLFKVYGADTRSLAPNIGDLAYSSWSFGGFSVGELALLTFVVALALLGGLQLFLDRTPLGRAIRATAQDPDTAELVGIDARRVYAAATAIALGTVAIAGTFLGLRATFDPYAGATQLIFAFEAVVIGGTGSLWGTLLGGIVLGVAQNVGSQLNPQGFLIGGHLVFLVVLAVRLYAAARERGAFRSMRRTPA